MTFGRVRACSEFAARYTQPSRRSSPAVSASLKMEWLLITTLEMRPWTQLSAVAAGCAWKGTA
jgi:hypothetical protein